MPGKADRRYVDTRTRYQGIFARHRLNCALSTGAGRCNCTPSYYGTGWDRELGRNRKTRRAATIAEARARRADLLAALRSGTVAPAGTKISFAKAHETFIADCREGVALNKHGRRYKAKAIVDLDSSLKKLPASIRRRSLAKLSRGDFQNAVDGFRRAGLSSSRIGSIINAARSLYHWAEDRELVIDNDLGKIRLPANDSVERDRVATPGEFVVLLAALRPADALPYALAAFGTARSQEIRALEWPEVDFEHDLMLLADDEESRKSEAARRVVPLVPSLRSRLHAEWVAQGRPKAGPVCPPRRRSASGMIALGQLQKRVTKIWQKLDLEPIGLQEARHTAATWLDHAGVAPKVSSVFMGHKAPKRQPDAAPITLLRYTHVLPGELERARDQLAAFISEREVAERGKSFTSAR